MTDRGIKIVSDGTVMGTRVFNVDGEDVTAQLKIKRVEWRHDAAETPEAVLTCVLAEIEVAVEPSEELRDVSDLASRFREWRPQ